MSYGELLHRMLFLLYVLILMVWFLYPLLNASTNAKSIILPGIIWGVIVAGAGILVYIVTTLFGETNGPVFVLVCISTLMECILLYRLVRSSDINKQILTFFILYLVCVAYITLIARLDGNNDKIILELFSRGNYNTSAGAFVQHFALNSVMFIPIGGTMAMMTKDSKVRNLILFSLLLSTQIESLQLIFHIGECDINDIISNTLGGGAGALLAIPLRMILPVYERQK